MYNWHADQSWEWTQLSFITHLLSAKKQAQSFPLLWVSHEDMAALPSPLGHHTHSCSTTNAHFTPLLLQKYPPAGQAVLGGTHKMPLALWAVERPKFTP